MKGKLMKTFPIGWPVVFLLVLLTAACAPKDRAYVEDQKRENEEIAQRITEVKKQLEALQEQLVVVQTRENLTLSRQESRPRAWSALSTTEDLPPGYGAYTFLLANGQTPENDQALASAMKLIDAFPAREDLSAKEKNRFLVPVQEESATSLSLEKYDYALAADFMERINLPRPLQDHLLLVNSFNLSEGQTYLVIDVSGADQEQLAEILTALHSRISATEDPGPEFYFWKILAALEPHPVTVQQLQNLLVIRP